MILRCTVPGSRAARAFLPFLFLLGAASAQITTTGPYSSESFEAPRFQLGTLPGMGFADGQDGWLLLDSIAGIANLAAAQVQTAVVRTGQRAVKWDAAQMSRGCFGELRRNATFGLSTGFIECEFDFMIASSAQPSAFWEFYTQPAPHPGSCQLRWGVLASGEIEYMTTSNRTWIRSGHFVARDLWHHARTIVDIAGDRTELHLDGAFVFAGQPTGSMVNLPAHGFTQINVENAGTDAFYLDNFTVRERTAAHGLSVDLERLPVNQRSVATFRLAGGASLSNRDYALFVSGAGTQPGTPFGGLTLPLNADVFFNIFGSNLGSPLLPGFLGRFNPDGNAYATLDTFVPLPPSLVGTQLHFAYLTYFPFDAVSEPARVTITL
jgi:hypothetical protein